VTKIWIVSGSYPYESSTPLEAFASEEGAQTRCAELEARTRRYDMACVRWYAKFEKLQASMGVDDAWDAAGKRPVEPADSYPEYDIYAVPLRGNTELPKYYECVGGICLEEDGRTHYSGGALLYADDTEIGDEPCKVYHKEGHATATLQLSTLKRNLL